MQVWPKTDTAQRFSSLFATVELFRTARNFSG